MSTIKILLTSKPNLFETVAKDVGRVTPARAPLILARFLDR